MLLPNFEGKGGLQLKICSTFNGVLAQLSTRQQDNNNSARKYIITHYRNIKQVKYRYGGQI